MAVIPTGLGLNSRTQSILQNNQSTTRFSSNYNNGFTRLQFNVHSTLPTTQAVTNFQARQFNSQAYLPVLQFLGRNGLFMLPSSLSNISPDGIMPYSQWGNPQTQQSFSPNNTPMGYPGLSLPFYG